MPLNVNIITDSYNVGDPTYNPNSSIRVIAINLDAQLLSIETVRQLLPFQSHGAPLAGWVADTSGNGSAEIIVTLTGISASSTTVYVHNSLSGPWATQGVYKICLLMK